MTTIASAAALAGRFGEAAAEISERLRGGVAVVRGRKILTKRGRDYKAIAAALALSHGLRPVSEDVAVTVAVYRPRRCGDLDNALKVVLDSLTGVAWDDDKQVTEIHARRFDDKANPRVEIRIEPLSPAGRA